MKRVIAIIMLINLFIMSVPNNITQAKENNVREEIKAIEKIDDKELDEMMKPIEKDSKLSKEEIENQILKESKEAIVNDTESDKDLKKGKKYYLTKPKERGDVYISNNSTMGIPHGHDGMYKDYEHVMMAPGPGEKTKKKYYRDERITKNSEIKRVKAQQKYRDGAITWAIKHLGTEYELNFMYNKSSYKYVNCSSYVYFAYIHSLCAQKYWPKNNKGKRYRIALDHNGGWAVYPYDIKDSGWTEHYKTIK